MELNKFANLISSIRPYRERTKEIPFETIVPYVFDTNKVFLRKDDGVQITYIVPSTGVLEAYTPKPSVSGKLINRTEQLQLPTSKLPEHLTGTIAHGEVLLLDSKNRALPLQDIVGFMNMKPDKAKKFLEENNYRLYRTIFDVDRVGDQDLLNEPFEKRLELAKKLAPVFEAEIPEHAIIPSHKIQLLKEIGTGENPKTSEGVVIQDLKNPTDKILKAKFKNIYDVYVVGIVPGKIGAAAILYSDKPGGEPIGKVGTGFSIQERIDMLEHPDKYIGRVAIVKAIRKTKDGVLFQPSFQSFHPEKGKSLWED